MADQEIRQRSSDSSETGGYLRTEIPPDVPAGLPSDSNTDVIMSEVVSNGRALLRSSASPRLAWVTRGRRENRIKSNQVRIKSAF